MPKGPMSNAGFTMMSAVIDLRNTISSPAQVLKDAGLKEGYHVLDFGCGPGGHAIAAAELVGEKGKVYALDIHPLALRKVTQRAANKSLVNVVTIESNKNTGLESENLDMVLLYDIFHMLEDREGILNELARVLKPGGILSVDDHHMKDKELIGEIKAVGLFTFHGRGKKFINFIKDGGK